MPATIETPAAKAAALGREPTRDAFLFRRNDAGFAFAQGEGEKRPRFKMTAIAGVPFKHRYWGNFAVDISTLKLKSQKIPILREHMADRIVGYSEKIEKGTDVVVEGTLSAVTADGKEVAALAGEGFPWEASVFVPPGSIEYVSEGAEVEVNGHKLTGPGTIFRNAILQEASFCAVGADPRTKAKVFSGAGETDEEIICAFSQAGEAVHNPQKEGTMPDPIKTETPAPAAAQAPATFTQADIDKAIAADRATRSKLSADIRALAGEGNEKLAQDLIDRGATIDEAKDEIIAALRSKLGKKVETFHQDPGAGIVPRQTDPMKLAGAATTKEDPAEVDERKLLLGRNRIDEAKAKEKFAADPGLQREFFGDVNCYLSFLKGESRGEVETAIPVIYKRRSEAQV